MQHLTRCPSLDSDTDAAAVAREHDAAEAAAQRADRNTLTVKLAPDGSVTGRFTPRPLDAPILTSWLKQADTRHPGDGDFTDDRGRDQRRGDHLAATLGDHLTATPAQQAAGAANVQVKIVVTTSLDALQRGLTGVALLSTQGTPCHSLRHRPASALPPHRVGWSTAPEAWAVGRAGAGGPAAASRT